MKAIEEKNVPRILQLTPTLDKWLAVYAASNGTSKSKIVRQALEQYKNQKGT